MFVLYCTMSVLCHVSVVLSYVCIVLGHVLKFMFTAGLVFYLENTSAVCRSAPELITVEQVLICLTDN